MNKPIFEDVEEAKEFVKDLYLFNDDCNDLEAKNHVSKTPIQLFYTLRNLGYIKLNPIEEAEKLYFNYLDKNYSRAGVVTQLLIDKQHQAINYLKNKLQNQEDKKSNEER